MIPVPQHLQRLAEEIDGWLELRLPDRALDRLQPLLDDPAARPCALVLRVRAVIRQGHLRAALPDLGELQTGGHVPDWVDLTEGWCKKRLADLRGAIECLERLVQREPASAIGHFNLGCYLSLAGDRDRAIDEVTLACGIAAEFRDYLRDDPDLDPLRNDARFRTLLRNGIAGTEGDAADSDGFDDDEDDAEFDEEEDELDGLDDGEDDDAEPPKPGLN